VPIQRLRADLTLNKYYFWGMNSPHKMNYARSMARSFAQICSRSIATVLLTSCAQKPGAIQEQLALLGSNCQAQMIATTCQAMKPNIGATSDLGEVVFVAGVGPVNAQLLAKLSAAGQTMCDEVIAACSGDWNGSSCTALKKMYAPTLLNK
jgi:predicted short-subunit dehydrogenase-like oxidoreductase (DUF2520 family)